MITIELGNLGSKENAEKVAELVHGQTFLNFQVSYGICAGNYPVTVYSDDEDRTEEEAKKMLLFLLASNL